MFKKDKKTKILDRIAPPKRKSHKKKALGIGLVSAVIAAVAAGFTKERDSQ